MIPPVSEQSLAHFSCTGPHVEYFSVEVPHVISAATPSLRPGSVSVAVVNR